MCPRSNRKRIRTHVPRTFHESRGAYQQFPRLGVSHGAERDFYFIQPFEKSSSTSNRRNANVKELVNDIHGAERRDATAGDFAGISHGFGNNTPEENIESIVMLCDTVRTKQDQVPPVLADTGQKAIALRQQDDHRAIHRRDCAGAGPLQDKAGGALSQTAPCTSTTSTGAGGPTAVCPRTTWRLFVCCSTCSSFRRSVVHCSAGIGRTGTLVALHIAYDTLQRGQRLNILALARNLRQHRAQSVQTLDQYLYIYFVILRYAQNKAAKLNIERHAH
ncbi:hypothetical protein niasHT_019013 [Heterodera trifolii]|uniref:Tyrosine specific protein phosphatases domain-containing protein n=1 Tax=Heterodera trifolii TaxID=157864 RepID=A0ABD2LJ94_9BILA